MLISSIINTQTKTFNGYSFDYDNPFRAIDDMYIDDKRFLNEDTFERSGEYFENDDGEYVDAYDSPDANNPKRRISRGWVKSVLDPELYSKNNDTDDTDDIDDIDETNIDSFSTNVVMPSKIIILKK